MVVNTFTWYTQLNTFTSSNNILSYEQYGYNVVYGYNNIIINTTTTTKNNYNILYGALLKGICSKALYTESNIKTCTCPHITNTHYT